MAAATCDAVQMQMLGGTRKCSVLAFSLSKESAFEGISRLCQIVEQAVPTERWSPALGRVARKECVPERRDGRPDIVVQPLSVFFDALKCPLSRHLS